MFEALILVIIVVFLSLQSWRATLIPIVAVPITLRTGKEFGITKIGFDTTLALLACAASLMIAGSIEGVREGTIIAALIVGLFARFFNRRLGFVNKMITFAPNKTPIQPYEDNCNHRTDGN